MDFKIIQILSDIHAKSYLKTSMTIRRKLGDNKNLMHALSAARFSPRGSNIRENQKWQLLFQATPVLKIGSHSQIETSSIPCLQADFSFVVSGLSFVV